MNDSVELVLTILDQCSGCHSVGVLLNSSNPTSALQTDSLSVCRSLLQQFKPPLIDGDVEASWNSKPNPYLQLLLQAAVDLQQAGDGGWDCLLIVCHLVAGLRWSLNSTWRRGSPLRAEALLCVRQWVSELYDVNRRPKLWIGYVTAEHFGALVGPAVRLPFLGSMVSPENHKALCDLVLSSFYASLGDGGSAALPIFHSGRTRFAAAVGPIAESRLLNGILLEWQLAMDASLVVRAATRRSECARWKSILFECALDISDVLLQRLVQVQRCLPKPYLLLVLSQKTISPQLRGLLAQVQILCIERLSIQHTHSVRVASGSSLFGTARDFLQYAETDLSWSALQNVMGTVVSVQEITVGCSKMTWLETPRDGVAGLPGMSTVIVCCPVAAHLGAVAATLRRALMMLSAAYADPLVVPGDGFFEVFTAAYLQHRLALQPTRLPDIARLVITSASEALARVGGSSAPSPRMVGINMFQVAAQVMNLEPHSAARPPHSQGDNLGNWDEVTAKFLSIGPSEVDEELMVTSNRSGSGMSSLMEASSLVHLASKRESFFKAMDVVEVLCHVESDE